MPCSNSPSPSSCQRVRGGEPRPLAVSRHARMIHRRTTRQPVPYPRHITESEVNEMRDDNDDPKPDAPDDDTPKD